MYPRDQKVIATYLETDYYSNLSLFHLSGLKNLEGSCKCEKPQSEEAINVTCARSRTPRGF
jgi:hypothetical protein